MVGLILSICSFMGFCAAANRWLKIPFEQTPFFAISFLGTVLFCFARFDVLYTGTSFLIWTGVILAAAVVVSCGIKTRPKMRSVLWHPATLFCGLLVFSFLITLKMRFTVIDDYVYWGIIGKYLGLNHHLPTPDTTILSRHLGYTPGTALIHYFFYRMTGGYDPAISYFGQNVVLLSALFATVRSEKIERSWVLFVLVFIVLSLFCGSVLFKLQVDYLLSVFFFISLWLYFREPPAKKMILTLSFPLVFCFLIKEVGFGLSAAALLIMATDQISGIKQSNRERIIWIIGLFCIGALLFLIRYLWLSHCESMGFPKFSGAINKERILQTLQVWNNPDSLNGLIYFLKGLFFGEADRLNLPYILWFVAVAVIWRKILTAASKENKRRLLQFSIWLAVLFGLYCVMNYFMQVIVFEVGKAWTHTVGLERYLNIVFTPIVLFSILYYVDTSRLRATPSSRTLIICSVLFILILGASRVETTIRREEHFKTAEQIAVKIEKHIEKDRQNRICIIPGKNDNDLFLQLLYYLLPNRISHGGFSAGSRNIMIKKLSGHDYVYFYSVGPPFNEWIKPYADGLPEAKSFYRIHQKDKSAVGKPAVLKLERLF